MEQQESRLPQAPYIYKALNHSRDIRLLSYQYLPDENEVTIQCGLITKSLDEIISSDLRYWALSYVWGDPEDTVAIICDGKRLSVTRNLHALLVNLFRTNEMEKPESGYVWADAICINQVDDEEKTTQVRLMQGIFSHADHVVAWLGEESESVKWGFAFIRELFATMEKYTFVDPETQEESFDYHSFDMNEELPGRTDQVWGDMAFLLSNPWFSRVWVVQEALMAKTLTFLWGTTTLPARILLPFADQVFQIHLFLERLFSRPLARWFANARYLGHLKYRFDRGAKLTILDTLYSTRHFEASDTRDKVFAVVGLAADIDDTFIDYSKKDPGPTLVRLAKHVLGIPDGGAAFCPPLNILGSAGMFTTTVDVPSWVVDWTSLDTRMHSSLNKFYGEHNENLTSSENERTWQFAQVTDDNGLSLRGRPLDNVESLVEDVVLDVAVSLAGEFTDKAREGLLGGAHSTMYHDFSLRFERRIHYIRTMQQIVDDLGTYPTGETLTDVIWRSIILDDECEGSLECSGKWAELCSMLRQCVDLCHKLTAFVKAQSPARKPARNQEFFDLRQQAQALSQTASEVSVFFGRNMIIGRPFSSTKRGFVGWMSKGASKGDELWIFNGCRVPFVLRPAEDRQGDERAYRLIGDCYIHGLMRSEASARVAGETQQIKLV